MINDENNKNTDIDLSNILKEAKQEIKKKKINFDYSTDFNAPVTARWIIKFSGGLIKNENYAYYFL